MQQTKLRKNTGIIPIIIFGLILSIYSLSILFMYVWGFFTSLKTNVEFMFNLYSIPRGAPWTWEWKNYLVAFNQLFVPITEKGVRRDVYLEEMFLNSVLYAAGGAFVNVFTTWFVAYLMARFNYRFSRFMYSLNLILMVVPIIGSLPSALSIFRALGLYDNWMFVVVNSIGFTGMYLLIFYAFIKNIGKEYTEASYVEGASNLTTMFKIIFPITAQMFWVIFLLMFIGRWNDYMTMVIWLPNKPTLAYGLYKFSVTTTSVSSWPPMQITGCMLLMLPIFVLFLSFQDAIMGNLRMGALKG